MVPDFLVDQNLDYILARGYSFKDFSAEQILGQLILKDIRNVSFRGRRIKENSSGFNTIVDRVPLIGIGTRWQILRNPFKRMIYRCIRVKAKLIKTHTMDKRKGGHIHKLKKRTIKTRNKPLLSAFKRAKAASKKIRIFEYNNIPIFA